jgi:hypothetical protein
MTTTLARHATRPTLPCALCALVALGAGPAAAQPPAPRSAPPPRGTAPAPQLPLAGAKLAPKVDLPAPEVARWTPQNRAWPGATVVFEGTNIDTSRFQASLGPAANVRLEILSRTPSRIVARIPTEFSGGRVLSPGTPLAVGYANGGGKVLNPSFVVTEPVTLAPIPGSRQTLYTLVTTTVQLDGEIEGIQWISLPDNRSGAPLWKEGRCRWDARSEHPRMTLTSNRFSVGFVGTVSDQRVRTGGGGDPQPTECMLVVTAGVRNAVADTTVEHVFEIPVTLRHPTRYTLERTAGIPLDLKLRPSMPDFAAAVWLPIMDAAQVGAGIGQAVTLMLQGTPPVEALDRATPHNRDPEVWQKSYGECGSDGRDSTMGVIVKDGDVVIRLNRAATTRICWWDQQARLRHGLSAYVESFEWEVNNGGGCSAGPKGLMRSTDAFKPKGLLLACHGSLTDPGYVELRLQRVTYHAAPDLRPATVVERVP